MKQTRWLVLALLGLALVLRVGVVLAERDTYVPRTDALHYDHLATNLANSGGFGETTQPPMVGPTALRAPLYPVALAATYVVFGEGSWTAGLLVNALLGTMAVALVGAVAYYLLGRRAGLVAMAIAAVHPGMILVGTSLQLEPLLGVLSLGGLTAALQHRRTPNGFRWPVIAGLLLGLAVLTREQAAFFIPPCAWLVLTTGGGSAVQAERTRPSIARLRDQLRSLMADRRALRLAGAVLFVPVLVVLPWTIRNAVQLHAFVPVSTSAGFGLVGTYNETSEANRDQPGRWVAPYDDPRTGQVMLDVENPTEVRMDRELRSLVLDIVREHPTYPFRVAFWNTIRGFDLDGGDYTRFIARFLPYPSWLLTPAIVAGWAVLGIAALGAMTRRAREVPLAIWVIPAVIIPFMAVFLPFSIRYRSVLEPFFIILAAAAVTTAVDRWRPSPTSTPTA